MFLKKVINKEQDQKKQKQDIRITDAEKRVQSLEVRVNVLERKPS